jgi:hypothetical protein
VAAGSALPDVSASQLGAAAALVPELITVIRNGDTVYVRSPFSSTYDYIVTINLNTIAASDNALVKFDRDGFVPVATANTYAAITASLLQEKIGIDDNPPVNLGATITTFNVGGGHGLSAGIKVTAAGHGKVLNDVGSVWKDAGNHNLTLLKVVDANTLLFVPPNDWGTATSESRFSFSVAASLTAAH